jgi:hypothetical protein
MPTSSTIYASRSSSAVDAALAEILREIAVPMAVLEEAKKRRELVLTIAMRHDAARAAFRSGSVAHGTDNKPLEDADGGVKVDRTFKAFRAFGPDAPDAGKGPEEFIQAFAQFVGPRLIEAGYPLANVNLEGNRAIKFEFNQTVDIDDWGPVDPYVDLIVGLARADGRGLWIPNRRHNWWDPADPEHHTWLMAERDEKSLRVFRAHVIRLAKRAVKRDEVIEGREKVMHSWNISALALESITETGALAESLATFFRHAGNSIAVSLTSDPSPVVEKPLKLPEGVSREQAATRLLEMATVVEKAIEAMSRPGARLVLGELYGAEVDAIQARERKQMNLGLRASDSGALAAALGTSTAPKVTRSGGA